MNVDEKVVKYIIHNILRFINRVGTKLNENIVKFNAQTCTSRFLQVLKAVRISTVRIHISGWVRVERHAVQLRRLFQSAGSLTCSWLDQLGRRADGAALKAALLAGRQPATQLKSSPAEFQPENTTEAWSCLIVICKVLRDVHHLSACSQCSTMEVRSMLSGARRISTLFYNTQ